MDKPKWTDGVMAAATVGILIAAIFQWCAMSGQLKEMHSGSTDTHKLAEATLAGSRAWVAPEQMILVSPIESGIPLKYQIRLVNAGKEPALAVIWKVRPFGVPYIGESSANIGENGTCSSLDPDPRKGIVLYPSGNMNFWLPVSVPDSSENRSLVESVQKRRQSLVIEGCLAYITANQSHTSAFRFFLRDIPGPSFVTDKQRNHIPAWNFNMALDGNQAN